MITFRIHFYDGERHPLDIEAENSEEARRIADDTRGIKAGMIKKIKRVKETVDG